MPEASSAKLSGSALVVQPQAADHDGVIAELRTLLQTLGTT